MGHSSRYRPQKAYLEKNGGAEKVSRTKRNGAHHWPISWSQTTQRCELYKVKQK